VFPSRSTGTGSIAEVLSSIVVKAPQIAMATKVIDTRKCLT
jgi:hypothetical protein